MVNVNKKKIKKEEKIRSCSFIFNFLILIFIITIIFKTCTVVFRWYVISVSSANKIDRHDITEILLSGVKHHNTN